MPIVVPFPPRRPGSPKDQVTGQSAKIVIFPGVRIERRDDVDLGARVADAAGRNDYQALAVGGPAG